MRVARVVVDVPTFTLDEPFDYLVPEGLGVVGVGSCVAVEFGARPVVGWVVEVAESSSHTDLKSLEHVFDKSVFSAEAVRLAQWIADTYVCPLSEALRLFTPPGGTPRARRTADAGGVTWSIDHPGVGPVDDRWVELGEAAYEPPARASQQRAVLDAVAAGAPIRAAELSADLGAVDAALKALEKRGAVTITRRRRMRDPEAGVYAAPRHTELTSGQIRALEVLGEASPGDVVLVEGVTGSGKTEVYLREIERSVAAGKGACVLVPEISLTPQTVGRFRSRFGDRVAVLHSRLSAGERYDQWDRVRRGDASIVVGARSALFAPVADLGLIIIDEEHEPSYKQGQAPRYHARDTAARLAALTGAVLVLGSASPSMESRSKCDDGEWTRVVLPERVAGRSLPQCVVVDMTDEFSSGHRSMFSRRLTSELERCRAANSKGVLFLNRRGFASFLLCRECGFVPRCDSCSTSLTYHEVGERLTCHHCGAQRAVPATCPSCASPYLRRFGAGTQRVQAELEALLPDWPVVRMDADTTKGKGAHERLLAQFEALDSGVLLGTQMIAKGLDYPQVTLVGVISADVTLNLPDFRAPERTYQLLEQVAGRAGRGDQAGTVVIQTYWPDHPAIVAAASHDPEVFYAQELESRRELSYPPCGRIADFRVWGKSEAEVREVAVSVAAALRESAPDTFSVLGPSPSPLARLKGVWRWHVLVKCPSGADVSSVARRVLVSTRRPQDVLLAVDVDPVELL